MAQHSRNLGQQPDDYSDAEPITTAGELKIVGAWVSRKDMLFGYTAQWPRGYSSSLQSTLV